MSGNTFSSIVATMGLIVYNDLPMGFRKYVGFMFLSNIESGGSVSGNTFSSIDSNR